MEKQALSSFNARPGDTPARIPAVECLDARRRAPQSGVSLVEASMALVCIALALVALLHWVRNDGAELRARALAQQLNAYATALDTMIGRDRPPDLSQQPMGSTVDVTERLIRDGYLEASPGDGTPRHEIRAFLRHDANAAGKETFVGMVATTDFRGNDADAGLVVKQLGAAGGQRARGTSTVLGYQRGWEAGSEQWPDIAEGQIAALVSHAGRSDVDVPMVTQVQYTPRNALIPDEVNAPTWKPLYTEDEVEVTWASSGAETVKVSLFEEGNPVPLWQRSGVTGNVQRIEPRREWFPKETWGGRAVYFLVAPESDGGISAVEAKSQPFSIERNLQWPIERAEIVAFSFSSEEANENNDTGCNPDNAGAGASLYTYNSRLLIRQLKLIPRNAGYAKSSKLQFLDEISIQLKSEAKEKWLFQGAGWAGPSVLKPKKDMPVRDFSGMASDGVTYKWNATQGEREGWMHTFIEKCHMSDRVLLTLKATVTDRHRQYDYPFFNDLEWHASDNGGYNDFKEKSFKLDL